MESDPTRAPTDRIQLADTFARAVQALQADPLFGVPQDARRIIEQHGAATRVVFLTAKGYGSFLRKARNQQAHCNIVAAVDDQRCHTDFRYYDLPVISTQDFLAMAKQDAGLVAVNTSLSEMQRRALDQMCRTSGIACMNFEQAVRAFGLRGSVDHRVEDWGAGIASHAARYGDLAQRMDDDYSVQTLYSVLNFHLSCDPSHYRQIERPYSSLYFNSGLLRFDEREKMVDCGASVGESLSGLIDVTKGRFERSWMIEPDRINIVTLQGILDRCVGTGLEGKVTLHGYGVGEAPGRAPFKHEGGHAGFITPGDDADPADYIEIRAVDEIIDDAPTFIKMDIEGAELGALKGARRAIAASRPKLAISAYHRATDLLDLTDYVLSLVPDYRVGLRHHTSERWDTCLYFY
jgi:FkbM family methyltransferase